MRLRSGAFALILAFGSACFFVTNLDGLGGGAGGADGGGDVGLDAPGTDGSSDAGFCAAHPGHTICSDFDQPNPFAAWGLDLTLPEAGTVEISDANFRSAPYSMRALARPPDSGSSYKRLTYDVVAAPKHARIELVLRACNVTTGVVPLVEFLCLSPNSKSGGTWLHLVNGKLTLRLHSPASTTDYAEALVDIPWVTGFSRKIALDVVFDTNGSVAFSGEGLTPVSQSGIDTSCLAGSALQVNVGASAFPGGPECESFYDDVLVDVDP